MVAAEEAVTVAVAVEGTVAAEAVTVGEGAAAVTVVGVMEVPAAGAEAVTQQAPTHGKTHPTQLMKSGRDGAVVSFCSS